MDKIHLNNERGQDIHSATWSSGRLGMIPLLRTCNAKNDQKQDFDNLMQAVDQKQDYHLEWPNNNNNSETPTVSKAIE